MVRRMPTQVDGWLTTLLLKDESPVSVLSTRKDSVMSKKQTGPKTVYSAMRNGQSLFRFFEKEEQALAYLSETYRYADSLRGITLCKLEIVDAKPLSFTEVDVTVKEKRVITK
jgi:hypothetical protein